MYNATILSNRQMEQEMKESRIAGRYPTFCDVDLDPGLGITRNLSTTGVCFISDKEMEPESMVRCFIPMQKPGKNMVRLRCEGRVVRSRRIQDGWETALQFTTFDW
jgi:hypothetical protein